MVEVIVTFISSYSGVRIEERDGHSVLLETAISVTRVGSSSEDR